MDPIDNHYVNNWSAATNGNSNGNKEHLEPAITLQDPEGAYYPQDTASPSSTTSTITGSVTSRTITTLDDSDINPTPERAHPISIFTAVLFHPQNNSIRTNNNSNNSAGIDDCQDTVTSTLSSDDDCDEQDDGFDSDHDSAATATAQRLAYFQWYTMAVGLIVGFFIQFSSLGTNFLLSTAVGSSTTTATSTVFLLSLGGSLFTSILGVTILLLLRCIVVTAWNMTTSTTSIPCRGSACLDDSFMIHKMESHFAIGALVGVCLAWTCTDLFLGLMAHFVQSVVTLMAALLWCRVISYTGNYLCTTLTLNPTTTDAGLAEPLLLASTESQPERESLISPTTIASCKRIFQRYSLALGLVVGFFIQFSSLGANFLLTVLYGTTALEQQQHVKAAAGGNSPVAMPLNMQPSAIVYFSFGWSFLTSCMGVLVLVLVRNLVLLAWSNLDQEQDQEQDEHQRSTARVNTSVPALMNHLLWCMESFFATGALLGVNVAWIATDTLLGLQVHWMHSILALAVALVWCKSVAFVLGLLFPVAAPAQGSKGVTEQDASSILIV
jgi:hypothetical protein